MSIINVNNDYIPFNHIGKIHFSVGSRHVINQIFELIYSDSKLLLNLQREDSISLLEKLTECFDVIVGFCEEPVLPGSDQLFIDHVKKYPKKRFVYCTIEYDYSNPEPNVWKFPVPVMFSKHTFPELDIKKDTTPYGYSLLCRKPNYHRLLLGYKLWKENLLDEIIYGQRLSDSDDQQSAALIPFTYPRQLFTRQPDADEFISMLPRIWPESTPIVLDTDHIDMTKTSHHDADCLSFGYIATETSTEWIRPGVRVPLPGCTEKSLRPFLNAQVPIFLAAPGHLNFLESQGFHVFRDLYPKNYDEMSTEEKVDVIVSLVKRGRDYIKDYYFNNLENISKNFYHVTSGQFEQGIIDSALAFINTKPKTRRLRKTKTKKSKTKK